MARALGQVERQREDAQAVFVQELKGGLEDIVDAIEANRQGKWLEKLSEIRWGMNGFEMGTQLGLH